MKGRGQKTDVYKRQAMDGSWLQLEQLFSYYRFFGGDWDAAEPDMGEMKLLMERLKKR